MPRPLDVYALLPQTNCRRCGEAACMAFAFALLEARRQTDECPLLREENATGQRETLRGLLGNVEPASSVWRASD